MSWRVLNANRWLPQSRERIIFVARRDGPVALPEAADRPLCGPLSDFLDRAGDFEWLDPAEYTLLPEDLVGRSANGLVFCGYRNKAIRKAGVRPGTEHLSRAHKQPNRIYRSDGLHPTLSSQETSGRYFVLHGGRDYQVTMRDFDGWKAALAGRPGVTLRIYPALNHLFVSGEGTPSPAEYERPGHVDEEVIVDIARFVLEPV